VGKLHDLDIDVVVKIRCSIVKWEHLVHPINPTNQRDQFRLRPYDDLPSDLAQGFGKSDKLDRIAKTVIAANQHTLVAEVLATPYPLKVTFAGMLDRTGLAVLAQAPIAYFPSSLEIGASLGVDPVVVRGCVQTLASTPGKAL
jgi:hypothetical protein